MKRFSNNGRKIQTPVFNYDLDPIFNEGSTSSNIVYSLQLEGEIYDLTGIVEHVGDTVRSGHYTFISVSAPYDLTKKAFLCSDDAEPQEIDPATLCQKFSRGYMTSWEKRKKDKENERYVGKKIQEE